MTSAQLQAWGVGRAVVSRRIAGGDWQRLWRGVIALHSGAITWRERACGALLYAGDGAALSHTSAAFVHGIVPTPGPRIVVSIPVSRDVSPQPGLEVRRRRSMPYAGGRIRAVGVDATVLDLVHELESEDDVVGLVCEAVRLGVLPGRLLVQAGERRFLRHRQLVVNLLGDEGRGVESPSSTGTCATSNGATDCRWRGRRCASGRVVAGSGPTACTSGSGCGSSWTVSSLTPPAAPSATRGATTPS